MNELSFVIDKEDVGSRIDKFLCEHTDFSRSHINKLIKDELVRVNGIKTKASYKLSLDDNLLLSYEIPEPLAVEAEDIPLNIVYEDNDIIVINKPKHLVVHPGSGNMSHTLVNALLYHCKDLSGINGILRPGIVHRIDKDTSGLLVCAKNDNAHLKLSEQLADKSCFRKYYALLNGVVEHDQFVVDAPIGRSEKDRQKMCVTNKNAKEAITHFKVLKRFSKSTLVECRLETGRTHQIRVHSSYIKHAVVNDGKYSRRVVDENGQILHAYYLSFIHPKTGERVEFETAMPEYFNDYIKEINE
ncbi:MAG: RluA family pseudouridine synthase [Erysipelotrichaceae bacterium]|nr:RluA family pseudouridine synthase [Erysipelotrichaceae bacterium]